ncbi:adrenodoxin-NADP+ reductase [Nematocida sp. AWRm77]|nr:adrenodoxin-NADP+ reductase [Nematocida sp. AWRm77]
MKLCVIGGGPASAYFVRDILQKTSTLTVDLFEKEKHLLGHLRHSVAPDQEGLKETIPSLEAALKDPRVTVFTNVEVGKDLPLSAIQHMYDRVVVGTGAEEPRVLGIPGAEHALPADALARKINGYGRPQAVLPPLKGTVAIIGNGNVALDMARLLLHGDKLSKYSPYLGELDVTRALVIGRGSPEQARFTNPVLAELFKYPLETVHSEQLHTWLREREGTEEREGRTDQGGRPALSRSMQRRLALLRRGSAHPTLCAAPGTGSSAGGEDFPGMEKGMGKEKEKEKAVEFVFWESPESITKTEDGYVLQTKDTRGHTHRRKVDGVVAALGYAPAPVEALVQGVHIPVHVLGWAGTQGRGTLSDALVSSVSLSEKLAEEVLSAEKEKKNNGHTIRKTRYPGISF